MPHVVYGNHPPPVRYCLFSGTCSGGKFKLKETKTKGKQLFIPRVCWGKQNTEGKKTDSEKRVSAFKPTRTEKVLFSERRKFLRRLTWP